ncbi:carboxypeptidase-like regulatory domain-containing protein [Kordia sp.]|uniref:carboxypeptidase-like regulatory domain-containing protein n=1 Tax=Kordia sp. TaxID=1965332 RepID=UPI003B5AD18A
MKNPEIIVQIPEPCHEDWNKMTPTEKGKFCKLCTKEVVDFSAKSDEEIINHLTKHKNLCGRFHTSQLDRKLIADRKKRNHWLSYAASLLLPMALFSQEKSQKIGKPLKTEKVDTSKYTSLHISSLQRTTAQKAKMQIFGTVTDESGMPLPGASIVIKGTDIGKTTDFDGKYTIAVKEGDEININYVGYISTTLKIVKGQFSYDVKLAPSDELIECVVVGYVSHSIPVGSDQFGYVSDYDKTWYPKAMNEQEIKERNQRTENYFAFQRKKWLEKRAKRRAERAKRKANKNKG